ncbi:type II secretion system F family protein [Fontisubflavum oceani]|uniref:type II secretion system F family protein n=1 Tax=Fontisubflavum oceani TaxID=2978973 RepID=UPI0038B2F078
MPSYSYTAINSDGLTETSSLRAADLGDALSILSSHGLTPIAVKEGHTVDSWWNRDITSLGASRSARSQDLEDFFNTFSVLLKAKLPLTNALRFCEDRSRRRAFRRDLRSIRDAVENGASLSGSARADRCCVPAAVSGIARAWRESE